MSDIIGKINLKFSSGNDVPITRAFITDAEWKQLRAMLYAAPVPPAAVAMHMEDSALPSTCKNCGRKLAWSSPGNGSCPAPMCDRPTFVVTQMPVTSAAVVVPDGYTPVKTDTLLWLLGEREDFECPRDQYFRGKPTPYFWRKRLRAAMLAAAQAQEGK